MENVSPPGVLLARARDISANVRMNIYIYYCCLRKYSLFVDENTHTHTHTTQSDLWSLYFASIAQVAEFYTYNNEKKILAMYEMIDNRVMHVFDYHNRLYEI